MVMKMINDISKIREKQGFICDMDGVVYHGNELPPCEKIC